MRLSTLILKKTLCVLLVYVIGLQPVLADTFIVTSNADSGPGSLRQAISDATANGSTQTDYIHFNLPDLTIPGRTITVNTALPDLTSKIVIDGSTQPGGVLGISGAKVVIQIAASAELDQFLFILKNISEVEIYGLKITDQYNHTQYQLSTCFYIEKSTAIKIGAAGKGNVITKWNYAVKYFGAEGFSRDFVMAGNFIGLKEDGETAEYNEYAIACSSIQNVTFGGLNPEDGNVVAGARTRVELGKCTGDILVANNKIGSNISGTVPLSLPLQESDRLYDNITIYNSIWYSDVDYSTAIKVLNNLSTGTCAAGIRLTGYAKKFYIQGNKIGTDITGTQRMNDFMDAGILIESSGDKGKGIIGVENDEAEKNIIAFAKGGSSGGTYQIGSGIGIANGRGITISRNSIFCDANKGIVFDANGAYLPSLVSVNYVDANAISGTASPGALIEFFKDDECVNCEGKTFLEITTVAGADGKWSMNNINTDNIVVTATDTGGQTSEFSAPSYSRRKLVVKNASCGNNNGSISGIDITSGTRWFWQDENGNTLGTDTVLKNVGPGMYRLVIGIGSNNCDIKTEYFQIVNESLPASLPQPVISPATCGASNGALQLNADISTYNSAWLNAAGDSIGNGTAIDKLAPGNYFLRLSTASDTSCKKLFGPYSIINRSGPVLNIDNISITPASCGNANGSIRNIISQHTTGSIFLQWVDSVGKVVGNALNLTGAAPGKYQLKFKDGSTCDTITTSFFTIKELGRIDIDSSELTVKPAGCSLSNGAIAGILTNAEQIQWTNIQTGAAAGNTIDISQLPSGNYELNLTNQYSCSKTAVITVPSVAFTAITVKDKELRPGLCGQSNGYIAVTSFNRDASGYSFVWKNNQTNQVVGTTTKIENLGEGTYELIAKDANGCTESIFNTSIKVWPNPDIDLSTIKIVDDQCSLQKGAISGIQAIGLQTDNISWIWKNENQVTVGNAKDLANIPAGNYTLSVTDGGICTVSAPALIVENYDAGIPEPAYDDVIIPRFSNASLSAGNFSPGTYQLFADAAGTQLLDQNETGVFITSSIDADRELYIRHITGSCNSMKKVKITVVDESYFAVPSAFTPNNDKLNDDISVHVIGYIEIEYFRVFNRFGKEVFRTNNIHDRWDGRVNGQLQPSSLFTWLAKGKDIRGNPITGKGTITLIK